MVSTGKLFEYIGSRKPIFGLVPNGVARSTITESKAGRVVNPDDVQGIKKAIIEYYALWEKNQLPEIDPEFAHYYDRIKLTGELARELSSQLDYRGSYAKMGVVH
jgi:hypothetical protein